MFFAENLGSLLTPDVVKALFAHLKSECAGRASVSADELRSLTERYLKERGLRVTPDAALEALAQAGRLSFREDPSQGELAA